MITFFLSPHSFFYGHIMFPHVLCQLHRFLRHEVLQEDKQYIGPHTAQQSKGQKDASPLLSFWVKSNLDKQISSHNPCVLYIWCLFHFFSKQRHVTAVAPNSWRCLLHVCMRLYSSSTQAAVSFLDPRCVLTTRQQVLTNRMVINELPARSPESAKKRQWVLMMHQLV